jgi:4-hydroxysphinganine ceramide fatty acyl 2-hydroxylase
VLEDCVIDVTTFAPHHPGGAVLLRSRKGQEISAEMKWHHPLTLSMASTMAVGSFRKEIQRTITLERGFMAQIWGLDHEQYMHVVYSPHWLFVPSPRMFDSNFLEAFTHCKWYMALLMPTLVLSYMVSRVQNWHDFDPATAFLTALAGLLFFTLVEYSLHRFIFHSERHLPDNRLARSIHFLSHGIHHMLPNDP